MHVIYGFEHVPAEARGATLAIGNFDGVHRGHQALLATAKAEACPPRRLAGVMVFEPHPREVFQPDKPHFRLTPLVEKLRLFERFGMGATFVLPFDLKLAQLTPRDFIERVLVAGLGVRRVVIGYDFHFGKGRAGNPDLMRAAGAELGFATTVIDSVGENGEAFSSSAIRADLAQGDVRGAAEKLGHWWRLTGKVVAGEKRGAGLGFPTANIDVPRGTALAHGIYAVRVWVGGKPHHGAAYFGTRPTFDDGKAVLEVFLFDFDGNLYGREISVEFIARLRGDRHFSSSVALQAQMKEDCHAARAALGAVEASDRPP